MNQQELKQLNWDEVRIFLAVAQAGSYRQAAEQMGVGHTTLARRVSALETHLATKLFTRLPAGLVLTEAGAEMLHQASSIGRAFDDLSLKMFGQDQQPRGVIRFTAPSMLVSHVLLEPLAAFCTQWPDIQVEVNDSLSILDLSTKEADVALRMTNHPHDELIGREVGHFREAVYASEGYLERFRHTKSKAKLHQWLYPGQGYQFQATLVPEYQTSGSPKLLMTLPDPETQLAAARKGLGIAALPCMMASNCDDLICISDVIYRSPIWLLVHQDARSNRRLQLFRDFLVDVLSTHPAVK